LQSQVRLKCYFIILLLFTGINLRAEITVSGLLERGNEQFVKRDYSEKGIKHAESARYNYRRVAEKSDSDMEGIYARARCAQTYDFLAAAYTSKQEIITAHFRGFEIAFGGFIYLERIYGTHYKNMPPKDEKLLADLTYYWALNLSKWIKLNGGGYKGQWSQINKRFNLTFRMGHDYMADYGAYRILGEHSNNGNQLKLAYEKTKLAGPDSPSANGWNNIAYAKYLKEKGDVDRAKSILDGFVSYGPEELSMDLIPENRKLQQIAMEIIRKW
jgi:hypothetical protein